MEFYQLQLIFLGMVFLFSGFLGYMNYRLQLHLIKTNQYKRIYNQSSDIKLGLLMMAIGIATGISLYSTNQLFSSANLGFFIPLFAGITLVISSFVEGSEIRKK